MFKEKFVLFLIAETPVHAGSGSEVGIVDLPIQRERHTGFPKIESSGLKGSLREAFENINNEIEVYGNKIKPKDKINYREETKEKETNYVALIFGPEGEEVHSGAITITDARILLFPVKSLKGVFAWITCPFVLNRFKKELEMIGINSFNFNDFKENTTSNGTNVTIDYQGKKVVLEEFTFDVREDETTSKIAEWLSNKIFPDDSIYSFWKNKLKKDLIILSDDDFRDFVKTSTEVITRIKIDSVTGTVKSGALWTEEYLPQDTIMYSLVMFTPLRVANDEQKGILRAESPEEEARRVAELFKKWLPETIQIGGNQTIGKGFVRINILNKENIKREE